ncbi:hypothetical protein B4U79_10034 [Dinothrombium tinctorium]|uniref:Uncharacterized protein n=1 Tax=Dinothrombium tinctorium TaxID=1965070 RepID=A0A3S3REM3_9ACAR|nr:hypothetical protein B4U79_10842 [Dinothrombium tinctorium]RWR99681.1 hypothetical protein B4U79_10034 [Dinothrombium tinctorium]
MNCDDAKKNMQVVHRVLAVDRASQFYLKICKFCDFFNRILC